MRPIDPGEQYEALARWVFRAASKHGVPEPAQLAMHKPLRPPAKDGQDAPGAGSVGLDRWLAGKIAAAQPHHLVDLGCGFGTTLFTLAENQETLRLRGIASSPFQIQIACQFVTSRGLMDRLEFIEDNFETSSLPVTMDAVLAVESIGYALDLPKLARRLSDHLPEGGHIFLVDDWREKKGEEMGHAYERFLHLWGRPEIPTMAAITDAFTAAGCHLQERIDLTAQVPRASLGTVLRSWALALLLRLSRDRSRRALLAAFLGGCHLERLYASGKTRYQYLHFSKQRA